MSLRLSIAIPVYNFAKFLPETLDSIVCQRFANKVEILILDGASTDETPKLIKSYQNFFKNIKYVRLPRRGGIDRDMAQAVTQCSGDYCWLFSGDDLMLPNALEKVLNLLDESLDLYLTRHLEWVDDRSEWVEWPTLNIAGEPVFQLSNDCERREYFLCAENTEAFFGFIGGLIVKKSTWESVPINQEFVGTCWAHVARLFEIMREGLSVKVLREPYLQRRPDNDSFGGGSVTSRFRLTIDGFIQIVDHFFGSHSFEAQNMRRVLRNEYHPLNMLLGKFLCLVDPEREDIAMMDRLLAALYSDASWGCWKARFDYGRVTPQRFRKWQPALSAKFDAIKTGNANKTAN
jgi:abequosyltransferase